MHWLTVLTYTILGLLFFPLIAQIIGKSIFFIIFICSSEETKKALMHKAMLLWYASQINDEQAVIDAIEKDNVENNNENKNLEKVVNEHKDEIEKKLEYHLNV